MRFVRTPYKVESLFPEGGSWDRRGRSSWDSPEVAAAPRTHATAAISAQGGGLPGCDGKVTGVSFWCGRAISQRSSLAWHLPARMWPRPCPSGSSAPPLRVPPTRRLDPGCPVNREPAGWQPSPGGTWSQGPDPPRCCPRTPRPDLLSPAPGTCLTSSAREMGKQASCSDLRGDSEKEGPSWARSRRHQPTSGQMGLWSGSAHTLLSR